VFDLGGGSLSVSLLWVGEGMDRRAGAAGPWQALAASTPHCTGRILRSGGTDGHARVVVSVASRQLWPRWVAVACGTAALCAVPAVVGALPVADSGISAAVLRARILASAHVPYQGYAESEVSLGIPNLPDLSEVSTLLDGTTDQYAWYRSPQHWRAAVVTAAGETDTYRVGAVTYLWKYDRNLLTRIIGSQPARLPQPADLLPPALGRRLLVLDAGTGRISRLPSRRIAGVDAAGLRVRPTDPRTNVAAVNIWADPATGLPVAVEISARGSGRPVLTSSFLQLSESRPAPSVVTPNPAPGVGVTTAELPDVSGVLEGIGPPLPGRLAGFVRAPMGGGLPSIGAYGTGFSRFAVVPLPGGLGLQALNAALRAGAVQIVLPDGTAAEIRTPLLTVFLASSTFGGPVFLLAGPVTPAVLQRVTVSVLAKAVVLP
jgi:hypothetical protein